MDKDELMQTITRAFESGTDLVTYPWGVGVCTPFVQKNGDYVEVYITEDETGRVRLSDHAVSFTEFLICGRQEIPHIETICALTECQFENQEVFCCTEKRNVGAALLQLIAALIMINARLLDL